MQGLEEWRRGTRRTRRQDWVMLCVSLFAVGLNIAAACVAMDHEGEFKPQRSANVVSWVTGFVAVALMLLYIKVDHVSVVADRIFEALPIVTIWCASIGTGWNATLLEWCHEGTNGQTILGVREIHCQATWGEVISAGLIILSQLYLVYSFLPYRFTPSYTRCARNYHTLPVTELSMRTVLRSPPSSPSQQA
eukprot:TRINITY_DN28210_c0_g1_i1.p1 TRINITY_DN28210_c0_g1~~TRINITY_DN28210_c0_g1_i1.p1  ORF type:complete len:206 (+),score=46.29 TRINITY_DN28210_c0_g1_i1:43-618(+)